MTTLNFSCLSREQREDVAICFEQNSECHKALEKATTPVVENSWEMLALVGLAGLVGGFAISGIHH